MLNPLGAQLRDAIRAAQGQVDRGLGATAADPMSGPVRVASVGVLTDYVVVPALIALRRAHAELLPDATTVVPPDAEPPPAPDAILSFACTIEEIQPIFTCVQENCLDNLNVECVTINCGLLVLGLSPSCRDCVLTGIATGDLAETAGACVSGLPGGIGG